LAFVLAALMVLPLATPVFADDFILVDANRTFTGRAEAEALMESANFDDLGANWPAEAVVRGIALGALSGDAAVDFRNFRPNDNMTRQEVVNTIMRAMGLSGQASARGAELVQQTGMWPTAQAMVDLGYSVLAMDMGIIPADFMLWGNASRQEVASILYNAVMAVASGHFNAAPALVQVYNLADWRDIDPLYLIAVENIMAANIMRGDGLYFSPRNNVTRGEMAQVLSNLDTIFLDIHGLERRTGTVAEITGGELVQTGQTQSWQNFHVRLGDGSVDILQFSENIYPSPQAEVLDAVVFNFGQIGGLELLEINHTIEYFVHLETNTVWYVNILHYAVEDSVEGQLFALDAAEMTVTLRFNGQNLIFSLVDGLVTTLGGNNYVLMDQIRENIATLPFGQNVRLYLRNNVVIQISFVGMPVLVDEFRGLVLENNPDFGYMVLMNAAGQRFSMRYYSQEMMVQRLSHWDHGWFNSYIGQIFPTFGFRPTNTIGDIVPGDIVFIRPEAGEAAVISAISAISNYIMRYGRIVTIVHHEDHMSILLEREDGQTAWHEIMGNTFIRAEGRPIAAGAVRVGDWVRLLVNEAVIAPGHMISSVREMAVEGDARHISNIVRGNLVGINAMQNFLQIEHAQVLSQAGWTNFNDIRQLSIANNNIAYYYNNRRITRDEALRQFRLSPATVYIALENHFAGERVTMVSFRTQREERLPADTVIASDGGGGFQLASIAGPINTDSGTIVRRHGRLVSGLDIFPGDHASVVLNGAGMAAVIDITNRPDTSALQIMRARVTRVWDGESFRVASMSQLFGHNWVFSPVEREFAIDSRTMYLGPDGSVNSVLDANFITYTEETVFDQVFTIVTDGSRATHIFEAAFANRAARGTIYAIEDGQVRLRDVTIQNPVTNRWDIISIANNTMAVNLSSNTLIGRDNAVVPFAAMQQLQIGDEVLVMTNNIPAARTPGMEINGLIVLVD
jgi:hypothetical protein